MSNASCFRDFNINNLQREVQLNRYITVAPLHQSYALCIEYMKHWFLEKFSKDFFSYIHLDGANVFGELNRIDKSGIPVNMTYFEEIEIPKTKTYFFFGARFSDFTKNS